MSRSLDWTSTEQRVAADHPSLAGHFPGRPVVPGVVILDHVRCALLEHWPTARLTAVPNVKFLSPLLPEEPFTVTLQGGVPRLRFSVASGERLLAQGQIQVVT